MTWQLLRCNSCGDSSETTLPINSVCIVCGRGRLIPCEKDVMDIIISFAKAWQIDASTEQGYISAAKRQREFVREAYYWYVENLATRIEVFYEDGSSFVRTLWDSPEARDRYGALTWMESRLTAEIHRILDSE